MVNRLETNLDYRKEIYNETKYISMTLSLYDFFISGIYFLAEATCLLAIFFKEASISAIASTKTSGVAADGIWLHATVGTFISAVCIPAYREKAF